MPFILKKKTNKTTITITTNKKNGIKVLVKCGNSAIDIFNTVKKTHEINNN